MSSNWYHQYKSSEEEVENKLAILKLTGNNPTTRYHPYERNEEEQRERRVRFATDQAATTSSNPLVEAIQKNIESLGGATSNPLVEAFQKNIESLGGVTSNPLVEAFQKNIESLGGVTSNPLAEAFQKNIESLGGVTSNPLVEAFQKNIESLGGVTSNPLAEAFQKNIESLGGATSNPLVEAFQKNIESLGGVTSNPLAEAFQKNIESLGGVIPKANWGGAIPKRIDSVSNDSLIMSGSEPAMGVPDALLRRAIRGSHGGDASPANNTTAATQLMPLTFAHNEGDHVYQPLPIRPIASSPVASAPAYTVEMVSVGPGIEIQKKKFLPRYLPMPIGTPPSGLGRPILGRGASLYSLTPQPDLPSALATQGGNGNESLLAGAAAQNPSADGDHSDSAVEPAEYPPLRVQIPKWSYSE